MYLCCLMAAVLMGNEAATSEEPFYQESLVFPLQDKHVHSSCIVECPNGDFLCSWFHGSGERTSPDVVIRGARLKRGETAWGEPWLLAETPEFPDCNPVLFVDKHDELWMFWITVPAERWDDSLLRYRKAKEFQSEGPPTWYWQDTLLLKPGPEFVGALEKAYTSLQDTVPGLCTDFGSHTVTAAEQLLNAARDPSKTQRGWMTRTHAVILPTGRILLPLYSDGFYVGLMALSDDEGRTWRASAPIAGALLNQPTVVRKRDGALVAYMREEGDLKKRVLRSESTDDGETWSVAAYTEIPNPNSSLEVTALNDGRWVMVYNDSEQDRHTLALAMSDDEGTTWQWVRHLECRSGCSFHYPSIIQSRDGRIHVTYTYGVEQGKSIKHVILNPEWIVRGD